MTSRVPTPARAHTHAPACAEVAAHKRATGHRTGHEVAKANNRSIENFKPAMENRSILERPPIDLFCILDAKFSIGGSAFAKASADKGGKQMDTR